MTRGCSHGPDARCAPTRISVVLAVGPERERAVEGAEAVDHYVSDPHDLVLVDDCTSDGTYEMLLAARQPHWHVLRNPQPYRMERIVHTLAAGYSHVLAHCCAPLVLKLDVDALLIGHGVVDDAAAYADAHPEVGMFGLTGRDFDGTASQYRSHERKVRRESAWWWHVFLGRPSWLPLLDAARRHGYEPGVNVFGGAYFLRRDCLEAMQHMGALDVPYAWNSMLGEDVYYSLAAMAAGYQLGDFAAPTGPLALAWQSLPRPARELLESGYKIVHSVDKGPRTGPEDNEGMTAREVFRAARRADRAARRTGSFAR